MLVPTSQPPSGVPARAPETSRPVPLLPPEAPVSDTPRVPAADVPADAVLVDVREQDEWDAGHAPDAVHIPMGELPDRLGELPEGDVHVVCRSGGRSARASAWLQQNGVDAVDVAGGMGAWLEAGRPLVSENGQDARVL